MQQTIQAILGAVAAFLAGVVLIGALAVLIVAEGYYLIGFSTRLYWRWKESLRQARRDIQEGPLSRRGDPGRTSRYPFLGRGGVKGHNDNRRDRDG